ncbi:MULTISPECIES: TSUP family transporter [unclassified Gilliamella]|uniref:TSUP family transporter n=2 Tax=unclassified Gilliamella TaxID=2685620 RepID=UPI00226987DF|nr:MULTISPECIES: TSUP family transporter [unclassified Gilliamella]MCX8580408.1 TSUP family transporter [Gilliamella sp. B3482]MCX8584885.1 TSUP family transporter [Gilliamella sp. B3562]MCX8600552.1 TSUP family transporter [Gilliamella sp. B3722]MCX8608736.1 TSUP family transporter [Gilliamella sp. B3771]MCX8609768.1 TSUP family transporter [Gilliamella sp. B3891]
MSYELLALLFFIAMLAGFIDSIAGGGGLLTVPALLAVGLPPASALATNKLQSTGGSFSASLYFIRERMVDLKQQKFAITCAFIGSALGTLSVMHIQADFLKLLLPILTISVGLYFLLSPTIGENDRKSRLTIIQFALLPALAIGFYDGFFGPGAGSFYAVAYITLAGFNLTKATAHTKVLNFTSNLAGLIFFIVGGEVVWSIGLVMLVGQFIGARLGAKMVIAKGRKLIRPMLITVSTIMSIKLIYENFFS